ncbi:enoyl-CoA hydratase/isomerase family protein [Parafrankia discariae]|uniref:enoyl-CoA hydratase/isomerase family protein n=1 Tax=Parafrankia discariae TaxID=365528 RepID=UPI0003644722|nr:enoyl-CoA hydratase/isomerase family protein [Parafrankia discariae]
MEPSVLLERRGAVSIVTLHRPGRRNGVTTRMCEELHEVLSTVPASDARVVVLRGAGDDFSVGADLTGGHSTEPVTLERLGPVYHASTLLHTMPQVTIAAIDGGCAGAAMGWACACDFRFASDRARFATGFLKVGVSGDMGLVWSLARLVGAARARELLFFPEKVTAQDALAFGLVTRLFPADTLHDEVLALADELAGHHPFPLRMMKANVLSAERMDLAEYIEVESARHLHVAASPSLLAGRSSGPATGTRQAPAQLGDRAPGA